ncbi:Ig-like domain-containing protein [Aeromonas rivipollensis]|uniref:beta strand repeat-containing protein n=1 Tax=Aeromonas rivipollensis TaxID=948519 RepID=UPI00259F63AC|nr:Ig-like domain-containing protein [Aeromonas rivipollensis]MDM5085624.1 Ig-like domain-containing protein [Aeromonas rivipollensis]MDM5098002.1 Ig-like domain-containing protein [Aeromonas rivipollensis]MDM5106288.1 Ig-like domain-containing protein [Aeromonas rivipollensis]
MNVFLSLFFTLFLFSCGGGGGGGEDNPTNPAPVTKSLTRIDISADTAGNKARAEANPSTPLGISTQYLAIATYSDNSTADITEQASWSSSDSSIATIDEKGLVRTLKVSSIGISASYQGVTSNISTLTITDAIATKVSIIPPTTKLAKGLTLQLQAIATLSDDTTKDVSTQANWQSSNPTVLSVDDQGKATAIAAGDATVTATVQGVTGQTTVSAVDLTVSQLQIIPATVQLAIGTTTRLTAIATFADQSTQDVSSQVGWLSSNTAVATVDSTGLVTGVAAGSTTLSASLLGVTASTSIQVNNTSVSALQVIPAVTTIALGTKSQLQAIATFADGSTQDVSSQVQWSSNDPFIASVDSLGLVTGSGIGQATVTATLGAISRSATLTVTNAITTALQVIPPTASLPKGAKLQFQAIATFSDNSSQDVTNQVNWNSSDISVATIDLNGEATAFSEGGSDISANFLGVTSNTVLLVVTNATVSSIQVVLNGGSGNLAKGSSVQFNAQAVLSDGSTLDVSSQAAWFSSDQTKVTINAQGLATGIAVGTSTISASLNGVTSAGTVLTVTNATVTQIQITPPSLTLAKGTKGKLTAIATYSDNSTQDVSSQVVWNSSNIGVATINLSGEVSAVSNGSATLTGRVGAVTSNGVSLSVTNASVNQIDLSATASTLAAGTKAQLTAVASYSDGSSQNITPLVSWSSSDSDVATVSTSGEVTAVSPGTAVITGSFGGQISTLTVTVTAATVSAIQISTPLTSLALGTNGQLKALATYSDDTLVDVTGQISWSSSAPALVSVDANGQIKALAVGSAVISGSLGGTSATINIAATAATLTGLTIDPIPNLASGNQAQLKATASFSNLTSQDVSALVNWQSDNTGVVTVSGTGLVHGVAAGTANITASFLTGTDSKPITITAATLGSMTASCTTQVQLGLLGLPIANIVTRKAVATFSDASTLDVSNSVTWSKNGIVIGVTLNNTDILLLTQSVTYQATLNGVTSNTITCP